MEGEKGMKGEVWGEASGDGLGGNESAGLRLYVRRVSRFDRFYWRRGTIDRKALYLSIPKYRHTYIRTYVWNTDRSLYGHQDECKVQLGSS